MPDFHLDFVAHDWLIVNRQTRLCRFETRREFDVKMRFSAALARFGQTHIYPAMSKWFLTLFIIDLKLVIPEVRNR